MNEIIVCKNPNGDWAALYVNGELAYEGHEIRINRLEIYCPIESIQEIYLNNMDEDDSFPMQFKDMNMAWFK